MVFVCALHVTLRKLLNNFSAILGAYQVNDQGVIPGGYSVAFYADGCIGTAGCYFAADGCDDVFREHGSVCTGIYQGEYDDA